MTTRPREKISSYHGPEDPTESRLRLPCKKLRNDPRDVLVLDVGCEVQTAHVRSSDFSAKMFQRPAYLRVAQQRLGPRHGSGGVRRKKVAIVGKLHQIERRNQPGRRVAGDQIHL